MEASILKKIKPHQNIIRMYEVLEDKAQVILNSYKDTYAPLIRA